MATLLDRPTDRTTTVSFPTEKELDAAVDAKLSAAHDAIEALSWNLCAVTGCSTHRQLELDRPPSFRDLGRLWSFIGDVETSLDLTGRYVEQLKEQLEMIDMLRRERQVALGRRIEAA